MLFMIICMSNDIKHLFFRLFVIMFANEIKRKINKYDRRK
jgi:hypothetical protein